jgi:hypothetical protein
VKKVMVIVVSYAGASEGYGLLGPQMAATIIRDNTDYECLVVAIGHNFNKETAGRDVIRLTGEDRPVIGFSNLGGRPELWELAKELKSGGAVTVLGGPQADVDYTGEVGWRSHPHRFPGVSDSFSCALQGPAEQLIPFLDAGCMEESGRNPGLLSVQNGSIRINKQSRWDENFLRKVRWTNLYSLDASGLGPVPVTSAQVVQQIGCPYASRTTWVSIDYPSVLKDTPFNKGGRVSLHLRGCSFCDVARDKGFGGNLSLDSVLAQIINLPEDADGRKIPFELVNEAPFATLPRLLSALKEQKIVISQINLVSRADWLLAGRGKLRDALRLAKDIEARILLSAIGFESFADLILRNLNKGYPVATSLSAITLMRQLKEEFPKNWFYAAADGASHGFIHPTPWDSAETAREMNTIISVLGLERDILPRMSTPLIIHHACGLADWAREIEAREHIELKRGASIIEWW